MNYRRMDILDLSAVLDLYVHALTHPEPGEARYPQLGQDGVREVAALLALCVTSDPSWWATLAVDDDGVVAGVIAARVVHRPMGAPKRICSGENVVVHPAYRRKGIAQALVRLAIREGRERGAEVFEGAFTPGAVGERIWRKMGFVLYRVQGAWVTADGTPRTDLPGDA